MFKTHKNTTAIKANNEISKSVQIFYYDQEIVLTVFQSNLIANNCTVIKKSDDIYQKIKF